MCIRDSKVFEAVEPFFAILGKKIIYQGKAGSGMHTKMCNQIQIAGTMIGMCESLLYGFKAGLDLPVMLSSISGGAAACWSLDNLCLLYTSPSPRDRQKSRMPS